MGDGAERERLLKDKNERHLDNVMMFKQLPKDRMPQLWAITDVSLVLLRNEPLFESVLPSKIFEAMGSGKAVILGVRGESQRLLDESEGGLCIEPENAIQLADAVESLADDRVRCRALGLAGRHYVEQHCDRRKLAEKFEAIFCSLKT